MYQCREPSDMAHAVMPSAVPSICRGNIRHSRHAVTRKVARQALQPWPGDHEANGVHLQPQFLQ